MKRIGLFGGSFDPIHNGHVELGKAVRKNFNLDEVWYVVSNDQPLKEGHVEDFGVRCFLVKEALSYFKNLKMCNIEGLLETPSYTLNTVKALQKKYPKYKFYFIIGDDQYLDLDRWYKIEELKECIEFIVVNRNDVDVDDRYLSMPFKHPGSSTNVRNGYFAELPTPVRRAIYENGYYMTEILYSRLSEKRAEHVLSATEVALEIAEYHYVDMTKVFLATILHDIGKEVPMVEQEAIMKQYFSDKMDLDRKVWHQYVGAHIAKRDFKVDDKDTLRAIAAHTTGDDTSKLGMVVYCADKVERTRPYETEALIDACKDNIFTGFKKVYAMAEDYRKAKEAKV